MPLPEETVLRARRLVLQNAVQHGGEPRPGPVVGRLLATQPELRASNAEVEAIVRREIEATRGRTRDELSAGLAALGGPEADRAPGPKGETGVFPPLPGAVAGRVVLRMAPFPSGALHIGNGRMIFVNDYYRRKYGARLLLVFDDTVGSEEKRLDAEMFDLILKDLELCDARPDEVLYKSDRIPHHYPWARRVIEAGRAYVCRCPAELLRENRAHGVACPERAQEVGVALDEWDRMLNGSYGPGAAVLRLKTDLSDPDPAFRDRVLFRISDIDHPRVGRRYRVWPLLEFSWAVDDVELGITHVLRGKDLVMEDRMQQEIWRILGVQGPPFLHWGLLRVREAKISKSKSYAEVKSGQYDGWADPRTWSFQSLDRRGISAAATRRFTLSFGLSLADIEVPAETLYAENRGLIDGTTVRRAFVEDPVPVVIAGFPEGLLAVDLANHPDRPELGRRPVACGPAMFLARRDLLAHPEEEIRLKDLVNVRLPAAPALDSAATISAVFTSRENKRLPRVQWVNRPTAVPVDLLGVEGEHRPGVAEAALRDARPRDLLQFERVGFVRVEGDARPGDTPVRVCFGHP